MPDKPELPLSIPAGTQVVLRQELVRETDATLPAGAVGVIVAVPGRMDGEYIVRFPDGHEAGLTRSALTIRKLHQRDSLAGAQLPEIAELRPYIIYRCIVGSQAQGLTTEASDTDWRGIYLPPARMHWALAGVPEQIEDSSTQECYWELQKFLTLALKANPNVLECLSTPIVEQATPLAEELLTMRDAFLSKLIYQTYNGYVMSQFRRLEQDLRTRGAIKQKHAMHLVRLLLSGITALREGFVPVEVGAHREQLLAIKRGTMPWAEVDAWRLELHRTFDAAYTNTRLPEYPDYARADAFLLRARRIMVEL